MKRLVRCLIAGSAVLLGLRKPVRWIALSAMVGCVLLPTASTAASTPKVRPPSAPLTAHWWQTYVSIQDPADRCDLGIDKVVFLNGNPAPDGSPAIRSCTLAAGTTILVPLINVECSSLDDPPFLATTTAARRACAKGFADQFTDLVLEIDGVAVGHLTRLRKSSPPFVFSPVEGNAFGLHAGTGDSASDGYWALIGPLAPGTYHVHFGGSLPPFDFTTDTTYTLTVV
jgi:hypothetical protein